MQFISKNIRKKFLDYFRKQDHTWLPSSPVIPHDDPTLLFINAGMNQFKDFFLGKSKSPYPCTTTAQKCIRVGGKHNDLENVGHTRRHLTFFEMLGNFSFGKYFKKEAIKYAWEVTTQVFEFSPEHLWVSVYHQDEEAFALWSHFISPERIVKLGEKDNFWSMGETGPCGPCSELLYDRGSSYGKAPTPLEDSSGERFLEFWNLVFMQFNRNEKGESTLLPQPCIDTGAGLERVCSLKEKVETVFETDLFSSLIHHVEKFSGVPYIKGNLEKTAPFHVIADHMRSLAFAISDGAQPSNTDRGYVLRKLVRRAVRYGKHLGLQKPFLGMLLEPLIETMGESYPELLSSSQRIKEILEIEEENFLRTLKIGGSLLTEVIRKATQNPEREMAAEDAFKLKDTYGMPLEEILLVAKDNHIHFSLERYEELEKKAKEISKAEREKKGPQSAGSFFQELLEKIGESHFEGYTHTTLPTTVIGCIKGEEEICSSLEEGDRGTLLLHTTPFYAEKGGQVGDSGTIAHEGALFVVENCLSPLPGVILHQGVCKRGKFSLQDTVMASIDEKRRKKIENNHTATHLLHWALEEILGSHIRQAGSLVEPHRLRFDFNHHKPVTVEEIHAIETKVNQKIRENVLVRSYEIAYQEAQQKKEIKQFFGDKYLATVRVIDVQFSKELCGGTHAPHTGNIGYFRILSEGSIAAGVRRITAVTGEDAEILVAEKEQELLQKLHQLQEKERLLQQEIKKLQQQHIKIEAKTLLEKAEKIGPYSILSALCNLSIENLQLLAQELFNLSPSLGVILGTKSADRASIFVRISPDMHKQGVHAASLVKEAALVIEGSGGGKELIAQAGGKNKEALDKALSYIKEKMGSLLQKSSSSP